jgi:hypothetical protein
MRWPPNKSFWRRVVGSPETIFQVSTGEIPVYDKNDSQQVKDFSLNEK